MRVFDFFQSSRALGINFFCTFTLLSLAPHIAFVKKVLSFPKKGAKKTEHNTKRERKKVFFMLSTFSAFDRIK
jgi:hypothetical protein